jgi:hypothetical protein
MRVWCRVVPLGDFEDRHCALYPAYGNFHWLVDHIDTLWDDATAALSDREAWDLLSGALYGTHGNGISVPKPVVVPGDPAVDAAWERYNKFEFLTNWGEQFDGYPAFLLRLPGGRCRVLYRSATGEPAGVEVSQAGIVATSKAFVAWFEQQERRLAGPSGG